MTTAYTAHQSPRLPSNHPEHVARILAREAEWRRKRHTARIIRWALGAWIAALILFFTHTLLK